MKAIVTFGEALIDFLAEPCDGSDAQRFARYAGGAPANVAVAVAKLGGRAVFVGMIGDDPFGDFLLESLVESKVDTRYVARTSAAKTALAFVTLDAHGERRFSFYRPPAADLLFRPEHFAARCFDDAAAFHVCSNSLTEDAIAATTLDGMRRARAAGACVSFDVNLRPALWPDDADPRARIFTALHEADLVKLCSSELDALGGEREALERAWAGRASLVIVTDGAGPIRWFTRADSGAVPVFEVEAIDTNAAGDAFVGGVLQRIASVARGVPTEPAAIAETLRFGAACGAIAVTRHGAFAALPSAAEVAGFLALAS